MSQDFDVISSIVEQYGQELANHAKLIFVLCLITGVHLLGSILKFIGDNRLKNKEKEIHSFSLKEKKRIEVFEHIYTQIDEMALIDSATIRATPDVLLTKISELERYINSAGLYIRGDLRNLTDEALDYFKGVLTSPRKKDVATELAFAAKFSKLFEKKG